jgi:hypothetical protein
MKPFQPKITDKKTKFGQIEFVIMTFFGLKFLKS